MEILPKGELVADWRASYYSFDPWQDSEDNPHFVLAPRLSFDSAIDPPFLALMYCGHACIDYYPCMGYCCQCEGYDPSSQCLICKER